MKTLRWLPGISLALLLLSACPAAAQNAKLEEILARTGATVSRFLEQMADVHCHEEVMQEKLSLKGKAEEKAQSEFWYLVIAQTQGNEPMLHESRETLHEAISKKHVPLLVTNGFATQMLIFHPYYQTSFAYDRLADTQLNGKTYFQIHFQHVKGRLSPAVLLLRGREYPLSLAGVALIDPSTFAIERITTELGTRMDDLGLKSFHSEVEYAAVAFPAASKTYWLPAQATVEVGTPKQRWKNVHRFHDYGMFTVSTSEQVNTDKLKQKDQ
ncbi:MAG TPA: hypothetical protein VEW69_04905 [Alphaproteobacteria bacterium]|nr:hypothetical protein [Alphaproteobacteria bacterium]